MYLVTSQCAWSHHAHSTSGTKCSALVGSTGPCQARISHAPLHSVTSRQSLHSVGAGHSIAQDTALGHDSDSDCHVTLSSGHVTLVWSRLDPLRLRET
eukprot:2160960-Rhodomonas_salina.1